MDKITFYPFNHRLSNGVASLFCIFYVAQCWVFLLLFFLISIELKIVLFCEHHLDSLEESVCSHERALQEKEQQVRHLEEKEQQLQQEVS